MVFLDLLGEDERTQQRPTMRSGSSSSFAHAATPYEMQDMALAGLSSFRQQQRSHKPVATQGGVVDHSRDLLQPGHDNAEEHVRLDPSRFQVPAGAPTEMPSSKRASSVSEAKLTDPITHFRHLGLHTKYDIVPGKRIGYNQAAAIQTWTWQQDAKVKESLGLEAAPENMKQKWSVGADGVRYYNMLGKEDMLPAATKDCIKCDKPARKSLVAYNNRDALPYCVREGPGSKQRPVHKYFQSDRMWAVLRYQQDDLHKKDALRTGSYPATLECAGREIWTSLSPRPSGKRVKGFGYEREPGGDSEDEDLEWRVLPESQSGRRKGSDRDESLEYRVLPTPTRAAVLMGMTPRSTSSVELRRPSLSMAAQNVSRRDASPRSMTPRSSIAPDTSPRSMTPRAPLHSSVGESRRPKRSASAPRLQPSSRDAAYQPAPVVKSSAPRGDATPRSMTPRAIPGSSTPRGNVTPRSMTNRSATPREAASLSMMPQLISRRNTSPRNATPRGSAAGGSTSGMRSSASEVVFQ